MSGVRHWWLVTDPGDGHAFAVENSESFADYASEAGDVEVVDVVEAKQLQGAVEALLKYGRHASNCATRGELHCTCGWEDTRARFEQAP